MATIYIDVKSEIFAKNFNFKLEIELHIRFSVQLCQHIHDCHRPWVRRSEYLHLHHTTVIIIMLTLNLQHKILKIQTPLLKT